MSKRRKLNPCKKSFLLLLRALPSLSFGYTSSNTIFFRRNLLPKYQIVTSLQLSVQTTARIHEHLQRSSVKSSLEQSITVNNLLRDNHHGVVLFKINFHFFLTATSLPPETQAECEFSISIYCVQCALYRGWIVHRGFVNRFYSHFVPVSKALYCQNWAI